MEKIIFIFLATAILAGCNAGTETKLPDQTKNSIHFKINGQPVNTTGWTISRFSLSEDPQHEWLNITSNMKVDKRTINVNLNGAAAGTYSFEEQVPDLKRSHGSLYPDYINDMGNTYSFSSGSFTITSIDTVRHTVNAIFKGRVKNLKGETLEITDGEISDGALNPGVIKY